MTSRTARRLAGLCSLPLFVAACGDAPTSDHRGYTKAPLETLGIVIKPEKPGEFRRFVHLNLPDAQVVVLPDSTAGGG